jgi:hypothetical protein
MRTQASFRMHVCGGLGLLLGVIGLVSAEDRVANKSKLPKKSAEVEKAEPYSDYTSWKSVNAEPKTVTAAQKRACEAPSRYDHEGGFINVYVNPVGRDQYLKEKTPTFEAGTVIVKEKLRQKDGKEPRELGVMIKREAGFAPTAGDWEFLLVDGKGNVSNEQRLQKSCAACHRMRAKDGYVFRDAIAEVPARGREDANSRRSTPRGNAGEP